MRRALAPYRLEGTHMASMLGHCWGDRRGLGCMCVTFETEWMSDGHEAAAAAAAMPVDGLPGLLRASGEWESVRFGRPSMHAASVTLSPPRAGGAASRRARLRRLSWALDALKPDEFAYQEDPLGDVAAEALWRPRLTDTIDPVAIRATWRL